MSNPYRTKINVVVYDRSQLLLNRDMGSQELWDAMKASFPVLLYVTEAAVRRMTAKSAGKQPPFELTESLLKEYPLFDYFDTGYEPNNTSLPRNSGSMNHPFKIYFPESGKNAKNEIEVAFVDKKAAGVEFTPPDPKQLHTVFYYLFLARPMLDQSYYQNTDYDVETANKFDVEFCQERLIKLEALFVANQIYYFYKERMGFMMLYLECFWDTMFRYFHMSAVMKSVASFDPHPADALSIFQLNSNLIAEKEKDKKDVLFESWPEFKENTQKALFISSIAPSIAEKITQAKKENEEEKKREELLHRRPAKKEENTL